MSMKLELSVTETIRVLYRFVVNKVIQYTLSTRNTVVVDTKYGKVLGRQHKTFYRGELYFAFEGIPFAKPPVGELRFRAPQAPDPWQGIRDCTYVRDKPLQINPVMHWVDGSEDCLYINVYAKKLKSEKPLPVLVWIYGGGFLIGEAHKDTHGPDYFMLKDVVLVEFNYRLGPLGFLSLDDPELNVPGNAGIKDQVLALRWVHENIANFNGDPNNVTLMGMSAGAISVNILMTCERTKGLFHKAIMTSGCSLCHWGNQTNADWGYRLSEQLGYKGPNNAKDILRFLQGASAKEMVTINSLQTEEEYEAMIIIPFSPVVEPYLTEDCVISKPHVEALATAWGNSIPLILGNSSSEGLVLHKYVLKSMEHYSKELWTYIPTTVRSRATPEELEEYTRRIKMGLANPHVDKLSQIECADLLSIRSFYHPMHRFTLARRAYASTVPTYRFRFDFDSPHSNFFRLLACGRHVRGVCHADDLYYMFHFVLAHRLDMSSPEFETIERIIGLYTSFAAHGDPNVDFDAPIKWEAIERNGPIKCLTMGRSLQMLPPREANLMGIYDSFYEKVPLF